MPINNKEGSTTENAIEKLINKTEYNDKINKIGEKDLQIQYRLIATIIITNSGFTTYPISKKKIILHSSAPLPPP